MSLHQKHWLGTQGGRAHLLDINHHTSCIGVACARTNQCIFRWSPTSFRSPYYVPLTTCVSVCSLILEGWAWSVIKLLLTCNHLKVSLFIRRLAFKSQDGCVANAKATAKLILKQFSPLPHFLTTLFHIPPVISNNPPSCSKQTKT